MKLYKIYKKIKGKNVNIGNVRAENCNKAKLVYSKQAKTNSKNYTCRVDRSKK